MIADTSGFHYQSTLTTMPIAMPADINITRQVPQDHAGQRLDQVASLLFPDYSRGRLQRWIREQALTVDGAGGRPAQRLAGGEWLRLNAQPEAEGEVVAQPLALDVLFHDEHILVLNKPAGLVVHPAAGHPDGTLQNALLHLSPGLATLPRAGIVHRLDKDTSGVMVVACSLKAHASLVAQLQERRMSRVYETVVHGHPPASGTVDAPVGRHPRDRKRMAVVDNGKPAVSHYRQLRAFEHFTHLQVSLESGRTHQIRVHMQHLGFPLVGDPVYGRKATGVKTMAPEVLDAVRAFPRQALHARTLSLTHPASGEACRFEAPVADDLVALLGLLARGDAA
jgi:23S rRNA pseudouridine1911/1915/1917 synthase